MQFLSEKNGLSMSKAVHLANVSLEMVKDTERELEQFSIVKTSFQKDGESYQLREQNFNLEKIKEMLAVKPKLFKLNAWLREAVKQKQDLLRQKQDEQFISGLTAPLEPTLETHVDEKWGREQLSIKELAEFLSVEAEAAAVGKYIHNQGIVNRWRNDSSLPPTVFQEINEETVPVRVQIDVDNKQNINNLFYELQRKHREAESRVNYYKSKIKDLVAQENQRRQQSNTNLQQRYQSRYKDFTNELRVLESEFKNKQLQETQKISALKIVVPNDLQDILNEVLNIAEK